jgi:glycosyltransferase involved in cell wall biosynthesis
MTTARRLAICYAAPGLNLVASSGPTRNVLSLAAALGELADVTVAFRAIVDPVEPGPFRVVAIDRAPAGPNPYNDDNGTRGAHPMRHLAYCRTVGAFARTRARAFDVVLEKGWRLSGLLGVACLRAGIPAALVENDVRLWTEPVRGASALGKYALHRAAEHFAGTWCRRLPAVIAETDEMKARFVAERGIAADRIHVVGLGVDHARFRPMHQAAAREALGMRPDATVLIYVGAMDEYHDLGPVIEGLGSRAGAALELHVVGEGEYRARYEAQAAGVPVVCRFHGRVPHALVPRYIAAADLCLAPYRTRAFHDGQVTFSTLKIPEYMACGRPVVSVPSGSITRLVEDGGNGFLLANEADAWASFLAALPDRRRLGAMGEAAARSAEAIGWDKTAGGYLSVCAGLVADCLTASDTVAPADMSNRGRREASHGLRVH